MHIVFVTYGNVSRLNRFGRLAALLQQNGHTITFVSSVNVSERVAPGCNFVLLPRENQLRDDPDFLQLERMGSVKRLVQHRAAWVAFGRKRHQFWLHENEFADTVTALQPDLVLLDEELTVHIIVALALPFPLMIVTAIYQQAQGEWTPPINSAIVPTQTPTGRREIARSWRRHRQRERMMATLNRLFFCQHR